MAPLPRMLTVAIRRRTRMCAGGMLPSNDPLLPGLSRPANR
jgi:hypothetical protein